MLSIAYGDTAIVFDLATIPPELLQPLVARPWIAHNAVFDPKFLLAAGFQPHPPGCSLLMARALLGRPLVGLQEACQLGLGVEISKDEQLSDWTAQDLTPEQVAYAAQDAAAALRLAERWLPEITHRGFARGYCTLRQAIPMVARQELDGIPFDWTAHAALCTQKREELDTLRETLREQLGIDPDKDAAVREYLAATLPPDDLAIWPQTTGGKSGNRKLSVGWKSFRHAPAVPSVDDLWRYRQLRTRLNTFGPAYQKNRNPVTGLIHPSFTLAGTEGYRFKCEKPNLQQLPNEDGFRELVAAPPGYVLMGWDYSQMELRMCAEIAQDEAMLTAYEQGLDLHTITARAMLGLPPDAPVTPSDRQKAKACNFGAIYGCGAGRLQRTALEDYGIAMTEDHARQALAGFKKAYPGVARWQRRVARHGEGGQTIAVTRTGLWQDCKKKGTDEFYYSKALNLPVQGAGAEVLLTALALLDEALRGKDARVLFHMHDEVVILAADSLAGELTGTLRGIAEQAYLALFPTARTLRRLVEIHQGPTWGKLKAP